MTKRTKKIEGWVEITKNGEIAIGRLGVKVYKRRGDILNHGFFVSEIGKAEIKILKDKK